MKTEKLPLKDVMRNVLEESRMVLSGSANTIWISAYCRVQCWFQFVEHYRQRRSSSSVALEYHSDRMLDGACVLSQAGGA